MTRSTSVFMLAIIVAFEASVVQGADTFNVYVYFLDAQKDSVDVEVRAYLQPEHETLVDHYMSSAVPPSDDDLLNRLLINGHDIKLTFKGITGNGPGFHEFTISKKAAVTSNSAAPTPYQSAVLVFNRAGQPPTAILPFVLIDAPNDSSIRNDPALQSGTHTHTISVVVPAVARAAPAPAPPICQPTPQCVPRWRLFHCFRR